jgi:hypothetical protein
MILRLLNFALLDLSTLKSILMEEINAKLILGNFEMSPRCHGNRKFKTEHVVTNAMEQSTFVPSSISIEAVVIVL